MGLPYLPKPPPPLIDQRLLIFIALSLPLLFLCVLGMPEKAASSTAGRVPKDSAINRRVTSRTARLSLSANTPGKKKQ